MSTPSFKPESLIGLCMTPFMREYFLAGHRPGMVRILGPKTLHLQSHVPGRLTLKTDANNIIQSATIED